MWGSAWYNGKMFGFCIKCLRLNFYFTQIFLWETRTFKVARYHAFTPLSELPQCINKCVRFLRQVLKDMVLFQHSLWGAIYTQKSENRTVTNSWKRSLGSWAFWSQSRFDPFCYSTGSVLNKWVWNASPTLWHKMSIEVNSIIYH